MESCVMKAYYPRFKESDETAWELWTAVNSVSKEEHEYLVDGIVDLVRNKIVHLTNKGKDIAVELCNRWDGGEGLTQKQLEVLIAIIASGWYEANFHDLGRESNLYIIWDGKRPHDKVRLGDRHWYVYCKIGRSENPLLRLQEFKTALPKAQIVYQKPIFSRMENMVREDISRLAETSALFIPDEGEWFWFHRGCLEIDKRIASLDKWTAELFDDIIAGILKLNERLKNSNTKAIQ